MTTFFYLIIQKKFADINSFYNKTDSGGQQIGLIICTMACVKIHFQNPRVKEV